MGGVVFQIFRILQCILLGKAPIKNHVADMSANGGGAGARVPPCPQHIFYFLDKDNSDMHPNFVGKKNTFFVRLSAINGFSVTDAGGRYHNFVDMFAKDSFFY